jgi:hypothetical protein
MGSSSSTIVRTPQIDTYTFAYAKEGSFPSYYISISPPVGELYVPTNINNPPIYSPDEYINHIVVHANYESGMCGIRWIDSVGKVSEAGDMGGQITTGASFNATERFSMCVLFTRKFFDRDILHGMKFTTENGRTVSFGVPNLENTQAFPVAIGRCRLLGFYGSFMKMENYSLVAKMGMYLGHEIEQLKISNIVYKFSDQPLVKPAQKLIKKVDYKNNTTFPQTIAICDRVKHVERMNWDSIWHMIENANISVNGGVPIVGFKDVDTRVLLVSGDSNYTYTKFSNVDSNTSISYPTCLSAPPKSNLQSELICDTIPLSVPFTCSAAVKYYGIEQSINIEKVGGLFQGQGQFNCRVSKTNP